MAITEQIAVARVDEEASAARLDEEISVYADPDVAQRDRQDIHMYQGDTRGYEFTIYTDAAQTTPWNFSAATSAKLSVKNSVDDAAALFTVEATDADPGNTWASGVLLFTVTDDETSLLSEDAVYDVQIILGGDVYVPVYGEVSVRKRVTPAP